MRRRFGDEAVTYLAEPLLAGIHAGDVERLSVQALFPRFTQAERSQAVFCVRSGRTPLSDPTRGPSARFPRGSANWFELLPPPCRRAQSDWAPAPQVFGVMRQVSGWHCTQARRRTRMRSSSQLRLM
jgi:hypothetical protein